MRTSGRKCARCSITIRAPAGSSQSRCRSGFQRCWTMRKPPTKPGRVIGPYTIVRELGRGGMGRVYLATDARLGRNVALKAIAPRLIGDPAQRERLRREARAAAGLTHPGICTVYALEEYDGDLFIAAEYMDGRTLREEIAGGSRPLAARHPADGARHRRGAGVGPRQWHRPSRSEARERHAHVRRARQDPGFRARPGRCAGGRPACRGGDQVGRADRHAGLHGARATEGRPGRCPRGRVRVRRADLRVCERRASVRGLVGNQRRRASPSERPGAHRRSVPCPAGRRYPRSSNAACGRHRPSASHPPPRSRRRC